MRSGLLVLALAAGCTFSVHGADPSASPPPPGPGADSPTNVGDELPDAAAGDPPPPPPTDMAQDDGKPKPPPPPPPADMAPKPHVIGDACATDSDCGAADRFCIHRIGTTAAGDFPQGYCSRSCRTTPCPSGSVCQPVAGTQLCFSQCPVNDCRGGYQCCGPAKNECLPNNFCGGDS
jgi:hypothetical protein